MPDYVKAILAVVLVLGLAGIFFATFLINKKTAVPKDCPKETIGCAGCMLNCSRREEETSIPTIGKNMTEGYKKEKKDETKDETKDADDGKKEEDSKEDK